MLLSTDHKLSLPINFATLTCFRLGLVEVDLMNGCSAYKARYVYCDNSMITASLKFNCRYKYRLSHFSSNVNNGHIPRNIQSFIYLCQE